MRAILLYDGQCGLCIRSVKRLQAMDCFGAVQPVDFHTVPDVATLHPDLTPERCRSRMQLIEPSGRLSEGFLSVRRLSWRLPWLWPLLPFVYLPGAAWVGQRVYDWVATRRFLFHRGRQCETNRCALTTDAARQRV